MGRPLPGYSVVLVDPLTGEPGRDGEICLDLSQRPLGLMTGYLDDSALNERALAGGYYHTGDVARRPLLVLTDVEDVSGIDVGWQLVD